MLNINTPKIRHSIATVQEHEGPQSIDTTSPRSTKDGLSPRKSFAPSKMFTGNTLSPSSNPSKARSSRMISVLDDEDNLGGMLQALVSTAGIDSAMRKVNSRVASCEADLKKYVEESEDFIRREEFHNLVLSTVGSEFFGKKEDQISELSKATTKLDLDIQRTLPEIQQLKENLKAEQARAKYELSNVLSKAEKAETKLEHLTDSLKERTAKLQHDTGKLDSRLVQLQNELDLSIRTQRADMEELEHRLMNFAKVEARQAIRELLFTSAGDVVGLEAASEHSTTGNTSAFVLQATLPSYSQVEPAAPPKLTGQDPASPEEWRLALTSFIEASSVGPTRSALSKEIQRLTTALERSMRAADKSKMDITARLNKGAKDLVEENKARGDELARLESQLEEAMKSIGDLDKKLLFTFSEVSQLQKKTDSVLDSHSKRLLDHAREFLNCATRQEHTKALELLAKCVTKEIYKKDQTVVQALSDAHTDKINGLTMAVSQLGYGKAPSQKKKVLKGRRGSTPSSIGSGTQVTLRDFGDDNGFGGGISSSSFEFVHSTDTLTTAAPNTASLETLVSEDHKKSSHRMPTVSSPADQEGFEEDTYGEQGQPLVLPLKAQHLKAHEEGHGFRDAEEDWDNESEMSAHGDTQLRQQVEAICMGLLCLAHHVLRGPPQLGLSRQTRLLTEKDLLDELTNIRHWVTNRCVPRGWTTTKLLTLSLRYATPRVDEVHGPQPQVILSNLLPKTSREESPRRQSANNNSTGSLHSRTQGSWRTLAEVEDPGRHYQSQALQQVKPKSAIPTASIERDDTSTHVTAALPLSARGPRGKQFSSNPLSRDKGSKFASQAAKSLVSPRLPPVRTTC